MKGEILSNPLTELSLTDRKDNYQIYYQTG